MDPTNFQLATLSDFVRSRAFWLIWILRVRANLPAIVIEGRRSPARQRFLFASGRTRPGRILTDVLESKHVTGDAFDIDMWRHDPDLVHQSVWNVAGAVGQKLGLRWGGRFGDFRHFER